MMTFAARKSFSVVVVIFVIFVVPRAVIGGPRNQSRPSSSEESAVIREVVAKYVDARERRDAKAIEALFTPDADQLVSSGEWRRGRNEVVPGTLASSQRSGGTRSISVEHVRFVTPEVAIADGRYEISGMPGGATRRMWSTFVLVRARDGWRISAIRNMLPAAPEGAGNTR